MNWEWAVRQLHILFWAVLRPMFMQVYIYINLDLQACISTKLSFLPPHMYCLRFSESMLICMLYNFSTLKASEDADSACLWLLWWRLATEIIDHFIVSPFDFGRFWNLERSAHMSTNFAPSSSVCWLCCVQSVSGILFPFKKKSFWYTPVLRACKLQIGEMFYVRFVSEYVLQFHTSLKPNSLFPPRERNRSVATLPVRPWQAQGSPSSPSLDQLSPWCKTRNAMATLPPCRAGPCKGRAPHMAFSLAALGGRFTSGSS